MSIYCSEFGLDEHRRSCKRIKKIGSMMYEQDDSKPCTCGITCIRYQGSHVLPSNKDERRGDIGFASIPPHITRNGKDNGKRPHPFMRFHLHDGYQDSVVLNRAQVKKLHAALSEWLQRTEK